MRLDILPSPLATNTLPGRQHPANTLPGCQHPAAWPWGRGTLPSIAWCNRRFREWRELVCQGELL